MMLVLCLAISAVIMAGKALLRRRPHEARYWLMVWFVLFVVSLL